MTRLKRKKAVTNPTDATTQHDVRFGTPEMVAQHRAKRLCENADTVVEIGAGAGFQTKAFAALVKRVIAVDVDAERLARFTDVPENVIKIAGDALDAAVIDKIKASCEGRVVVFLDPERPAASSHRALDEIEPDIPTFLREYRAITEEIAIELPPFLTDIPFPCEREYLSVDSKLNRLTVYTGLLRHGSVAVVRLPEGDRIESDNRPPAMQENLDPKLARFILEPDAALAHAGLTSLALPGFYRKAMFGKKLAFLASKQPANPWLRAYRIVASGDDAAIRRALQRRPAQAIILHGTLTPQEQARTLKEYKSFLKGTGRLHLFLGASRYLTTRE